MHKFKTIHKMIVSLLVIILAAFVISVSVDITLTTKKTYFVCIVNLFYPQCILIVNVFTNDDPSLMRREETDLKGIGTFH